MAEISRGSYFWALLIVEAAAARTRTVYCSAGMTIGGVMQTLDPQQNNTILLVGRCHRRPSLGSPTSPT